MSHLSDAFKALFPAFAPLIDAAEKDRQEMEAETERQRAEFRAWREQQRQQFEKRQDALVGRRRQWPSLWRPTR